MEDLKKPNEADQEVNSPGELSATIELIVREGIFDPDGKITNRIGPKKSESFVRQFLDLLFFQMNGITELNPHPIVNTGGFTVYMGATSLTFACNAAISSILSGIVVGTGVVAPTVNDFALGTIILHDAAPPTAGRLQYGAVGFGAPSSDPTTSQFTITRAFANASGGLITVTEVGLYVRNTRGDQIAPVDLYFMTIRDVIAGGIAVPNGQTLTVNYRPQAVV